MRNAALVVAILLGIAAAVGINRYLVKTKHEVQQEFRLVAVARAKRSMEKGEAPSWPMLV